ncbi:MAG: hypothetical protein P4K94_08515 [Terracidiphilus sp.]|nr:hypothetical protein [Terracidiphilus sp.]
MKFSEIANRLTGISTPLGGASWQPAEMEVATARRVIAFLEDRRVLFEPSEMEVPSHCVHSVIEIRHRLSDELGKLDGNGSELAASLRAMRAGCRKFLERVGNDGSDGIHRANGWGFHSWTFGRALGELRGTFGIHVAKIAAAFKLDVEDRLASILPANAETDTGDDDRLFSKLYL